MTTDLFHAMIWLSSWGDDRVLISKLKDRPEIFSIFHVMGTASYLLDVFVAHKKHLRHLIWEIKRYVMSPQFPMPIVNSLSTQKILKVYKYQKEFNITYYSEDRVYAFTRLYYGGSDELFSQKLMNEPVLKSILRLQGGITFLLEVMASNSHEVINLLERIKAIPAVSQLETQEVLSVVKYRGVLFEDPTALPTFIAPTIKPGDVVTL